METLEPHFHTLIPKPKSHGKALGVPRVLVLFFRVPGLGWGFNGFMDLQVGGRFLEMFRVWGFGFWCKLGVSGSWSKSWLGHREDDDG